MEEKSLIHWRNASEFKEYKLVDNRLIKLSQCVVYQFFVPNDVRNFNSLNHIAEMFNTFLNSDKGKWVLENSYNDLWYNSYKEYDRNGEQFKIVATFAEPTKTIYYLKWK